MPETGRGRHQIGAGPRGRPDPVCGHGSLEHGLSGPQQSQRRLDRLLRDGLRGLGRGRSPGIRAARGHGRIRPRRNHNRGSAGLSLREPQARLPGLPGLHPCHPAKVPPPAGVHHRGVAARTLEQRRQRLDRGRRGGHPIPQPDTHPKSGAVRGPVHLEQRVAVDATEQTPACGGHRPFHRRARSAPLSGLPAAGCMDPRRGPGKGGAGPASDGESGL